MNMKCPDCDGAGIVWVNCAPLCATHFQSELPSGLQGVRWHRKAHQETQEAQEAST